MSPSFAWASGSSDEPEFCGIALHPGVKQTADRNQRPKGRSQERTRHRRRLCTMSGTIRQNLVELLRSGPRTARDLSRLLHVPEREVHLHLQHVERSLPHTGERLVVEPAVCLGCGYSFRGRTKFTRPSRCPRCSATHIASPRYSIVSGARSKTRGSQA